MKKIILAMTGASGVICGIRLLESLRRCGQAETHLILSEAAIWNIGCETDDSISRIRGLADAVYDWDQLWAAPASGSCPADAMVICPCSMKTLAAVRYGFADNLISRAADVAIKEKRQLILCPRETPLSPIHLDNMAYLAHIGVSIVPPMLTFYQKPHTVEDLITHHSMKIFDLLQLPFPNAPRWNGGV